MTHKTVSEKRRGKDGRFTSTSGTNPELHIDGDGVGKYKKKRKEVMRMLFEAYVKVFFLIGTVQDYIPFSSTSGPFVETFEKILKGTYLLGRRNRSEILQEIYKGEELKGIPSQIARRTFKHASTSTSTSRPKVYMFRRLPSMSNYSLEILPLKAWLRSLEAEKVMACSYDEAYAHCCMAIGSYQIIGEKPVYVGFPAAKQNASSSVDGDGNSSSQENRHPNIMEPYRSEDNHASQGGAAGLGQCGEASETPNSCACGSGANESGLTAAPCNAVADPMEVVEPVDDTCLLHMNEFLEFAHDDTYFKILCMVFDERLESKFHFVSGSFLEKNKNGNLEIPSFLKRVLLHCHAKAFGIRDKAEHERRERSLLSLKENVARLRAIYGLKSYAEICWPQGTRWSSPM